MAPKPATGSERNTIKPRPLAGKLKNAPPASVTSSISSAQPRQSSKSRAFVAVPSKSLSATSTVSKAHEDKEQLLDESDNYMGEASELLVPLFKIWEDRPPDVDPQKVLSSFQRVHRYIVSPIFYLSLLFLITFIL